eukprot:CAMPEP_0114501566 /NCGR_PEP_ID=MMETSP0109-20121206/8563_1 /TAXON_ID=29199 /ORGANISM="Chlorarachnion reptans, Strain CCCM449" /LENGTH=161 /DNA_ID=CAMNT_0001679297 /DNA_START=111 /DNA_END=596 /DNA_ORIENTATION=+
MQVGTGPTVARQGLRALWHGRGRLNQNTPGSRFKFGLEARRHPGGSPFSVRAGPPVSPGFKNAIDEIVTTNKIVLFMKGTRERPNCGFSNTCVQILNRLGLEYSTVDVLENPQVREGMKVYSDWPTFPQLYIGGEFYGGCDIVQQGYESGDLIDAVEKSFE